MRQNKHYKKLRRLVRGGTTRMQKPAAPSSENASAKVLNQPANQIDEGVLRLDKSNHLPMALAEAGENGETDWKPGSLVIGITVGAIVFIGVITWFISQMPAR
ncbi:MAG TPA: hypothetical protein PKC13_28330 [Blastocatellia bacterium]|nr:hypothetical protein [Blastocatellia bacterium]HMX29526.1 hypothetical protein [Blastocatellia bacterium]HMY75698.1 hypothetical protein [Blastocatellia bacterium]HNG33583.1 hypothetical protein [Blastocatellia bacterium]